MKHKDDKKSLYKENSTDSINNNNTTKNSDSLYSLNEKKDESSHHENESTKTSDFDIENLKQKNTTPNNISTKNSTKSSTTKSRKGRYFLIYGVIIVLFILLFSKVSNKLNTNKQVSIITSNTPISSENLNVSNFNSSNVNLGTLEGVKTAQADQLKTFSDSIQTPFIPSNYELDPMSTNLLNNLYLENCENSNQNPLTVADATKILNSITIPFSTTAAYFGQNSDQSTLGLVTLDKNLYVTNVINEAAKGLALVSFDFGDQINNGQLITIEGIALLTYNNNTWQYSRMLEQKSVKTYSYLTDNDLKNIFNTYMTNAYYNLVPSSIKISNITVVNPYVVKATISAKGIKVFANGQINKPDVNKTWNVTFVKDRSSSLSVNYLKLVVGDWNVYQI